MTQQNVMELAKSGDPQAIAALINRSLASKGIQATATIEAECLNISLQASQIPNQKAVVTIIHRGMMILQVEQIKRVKILTHRSDNNYLAWQHEFNLGDYQKSAQSEDLELNSRLDDPRSNIEPSQNINLVRNPKDVILVQKFSQIQQNSQEYQDIIVRFTDEQIGAVRCLTTLTELIQVISKPSFLFAAVAANPNLRSLLDTIAESSETDEHGDQVITNLSILQPGQQWQKAKIRLVTKIFLEPNLDQEEQPQDHQGITLDLVEPVHESNANEQEIAIPESTLATKISEEATINSDSITADSLFDDFPESHSTVLQEIQEINEEATSTPIHNQDIDRQDMTVTHQEDGEIRDTAEALFEDFTYPQTSPQVIGDHTQDTEFADSLFDDFMINSSNEFTEVTSPDPATFNEAPPINPINNDVAASQSEDDLFGDFNFVASSQEKPTSEYSIATAKSEIDTIKSKIPKQDLARLISLINDDEQDRNPQLNDPTNHLSEDSSEQSKTTIEQVLGSMNTLTIDKQESIETRSITLEDFWEDLESVGF